MNGFSGTYIDHSGFLIETPSAALLFDWVKGELPGIRADKPLYVFISHIHSDHFKQNIFDLKQKYPKAEFFFGYDKSIPQYNSMIEKLPATVLDVLSCFEGDQKLYSDDGRMLVRTLISTDEGVAFLVEIDGKTIYHAGDLYIMAAPAKDPLKQAMAMMTGKINVSYEEPDQKEIDLFERYTEPLRGLTIDYAMLPVDPRYPRIAFETVKRYLAKADIKAWSPMHLWGKYDFIDEFLEQHPEFVPNIVAVTKNDKAKKQLTLGERFAIPYMGDGGGFKKISREVRPNDPCPCGSGKKYKMCCGYR